MPLHTKIEWTDRTWNPVRGCSIVSPGCVNCYAMKQAHRFSGKGRAYEGLTKQTSAGPQWTGKVRPVEDALLEPLKWKKPQRVFVNSMSDLFHESVPDEFIDLVFAVMAIAETPHTFQILTKRADRMRKYMTNPDVGQRVAEAAMLWKCKGTFDDAAAEPDWTAEDAENYINAWPLPNVWLGVSCEDQQRADERIPLLLQTPSAVRFVSAEPLIGPLSLSFAMRPPGPPDPPVTGPSWNRRSVEPRPWIDWVIVGGESGHGARECDVAWVRAIIKQCGWSGVPVFVKQLGSNPVSKAYPVRNLADAMEAVGAFITHPKGGDPSEWAEDLCVRQFPAEARS